MKKVFISVGPIPARLDTVKFITNRFKGGLAMKTASYLVNKGMDVTVVKWKFTDTKKLEDVGIKVISVLDVFEYFDYIKENANNYDAFIMAAAVANLTPSNPYPDKFPSHLYQVGEKFNIEFEIAPRAIDVVKKLNPRCCLIGYKLFDAKSDEELVEIARHTLKDSKANIIFANTPKDAKTRKIALFQDDTTLECTFDEHMELIERAINSNYFKTEVDADMFNTMESWMVNKILAAKEVVRRFEETLEETHGNRYGTIAIKISDKGDFVTTSRGHSGTPVYVSSVDLYDRVIHADGKATLNAPALAVFLEHKDYDYVIHKHDFNREVDYVLLKYTFPGTFEEAHTIGKALAHSNVNSIMEAGHGYLQGYSLRSLDWNKYYEVFGDTYARYPEDIQQLMDNTSKKDWLDVGCNVHTTAEYVLDPYVVVPHVVNLGYTDLKNMQFKLITLKNCINYLSNSEIEQLVSALKPGGQIVANSFTAAPMYRVKGDEAIYCDDELVHHFKIKSEDEVYYHTFRKLDMEKLEEIGFKVSYYNKDKSMLLIYTKPEE